jgi:hypothetical protein
LLRTGSTAHTPRGGGEERDLVVQFVDLNEHAAVGPLSNVYVQKQRGSGFIAPFPARFRVLHAQDDTDFIRNRNRKLFTTICAELLPRQHKPLC